METELSYMDLLNKLYDDVESNVSIPEWKRHEILEMISRLEAKLWKYSA
jgi:hypothetical protein